MNLYQKRKWKKRILLFILLLIAVVGAIFGIRTYQEYSKQYTGKQWLERQDYYIDQLADYSDDVDDVFALYINENISEEDFVNHLDVLESELTLLKKEYTQEKEEHPVRTGSSSYAAKKGAESVEKLYDVFGDIIEMGYTNSDSTYKIAYYYLAYHQEIIDCIAGYQAGTYLEENSSESGN